MHRARAIATALCLMGATACTQTPPISTPTSSPASATSMTTTSTPSGPASSSPADETAAILDATKRYFEEFSSALHTRDTTKFRTTFLTLCVVFVLKMQTKSTPSYGRGRLSRVDPCV